MPRLQCPRANERGLEVGRKRGRDVDLLPAHRVREAEPVRVQELSLEAEIALRPVLRVAGDGEVDCGEMDADLVRAAGLEAHVEEGVPRERLGHLEMRHRLARLRGVERAPRGVAAVAADRRVDAAGTGPRMPAHEREVAALDLTPPNRPLERGVRLPGARDDEESRSVAVE